MYLLGQAQAISSLSHNNIITLAGIHTGGKQLELSTHKCKLFCFFLILLLLLLVSVYCSIDIV